jgi:phosphate starvation-inducible PhoH-like protein
LEPSTILKKQTKKDTSPYVFQNKKRNVNATLSEKIPFTDRQLEYIQLAQDKKVKMVFTAGPAGTAKTLLATYIALNALIQKKVSDIVYIRSAVESASHRLGFLPGEMEDKFSPYLSPLMDKLDELVGEADAEKLVKEDFVVGRPINYLRGCHFAGKFIIVDEAQNFDRHELITCLTRIGEFSKIIVCGDPMQSDINGKSAFLPFFNAFNTRHSRKNGIFTFRFDTEDIVRSEFVKHVVEVAETI